MVLRSFLPRWPWLGWLKRLGVLTALVLLVTACARGAEEGSRPQAGDVGLELIPTRPQVIATRVPRLALALDPADVTLAPAPLRAGSPFTVTALVHNRSDVYVADVPVVVLISAVDQELDYRPFLHTLTITTPPSTSVPVSIPVRANLGPGEHRLWVQVNRTPDAWQVDLPVQPEADLADNTVLLDVRIEPFDAPASTLCAGRVDLEIEPADIFVEPDADQVLVTIHNLGNRAVYNVPVVVFSARASGLAYTPVIPPCGGTVRMPVELEGNLAPGDSVTVQINPVEWTSEVEEDNFENNLVTVPAWGAEPPALQQPADYDFWAGRDACELTQPGVLVITLQNRGTRDADAVPVRIEDEAGRRLVDQIPLVRGQGMGVGAIRLGSLATRGGILTVTINPADAEGSYPEAKRDDNVVSCQLPE